MVSLRKALCRGGALAAVFGVVVCSTAASADPSPSPFMRVHGNAHPPYGFILFCESFPQDCVDSAGGDQRMVASVSRLAELDAINRAVNAAIEPATDLDIYGVSEHWTIPTTRGDCEDYALLKRRMLIARGWPIGSVVMTVVRDEKGEGHAILTARTTNGDYILDNKVDELRLWHKTPYEYVMRQSSVHARAWLSLDPRHSSSPPVASRSQRNAPQASVADGR